MSSKSDAPANAKEERKEAKEKNEAQFQFNFADPVSPTSPVQFDVLENEKQLLGMEMKSPVPDPFFDSLEQLGEGSVQIESQLVSDIPECATEMTAATSNKPQDGLVDSKESRRT